MTRKILLIPEIHHFNWLLYLFVSLFFKVQTIEVTSSMARRFSNRLKLVDLQELLGWENCTIYHSEAQQLACEILSGMKIRSWQITLRGLKLDLTAKAKQDIQIEVDKLFLIGKLFTHLDNEVNPVTVVETLSMRFLRRLDSIDEGMFLFSKSRLSLLNVFIDRMYLYVKNWRLATLLLFNISRGLFNKAQNTLRPVTYLWDGISPRELSIDKTKISFAWVVDDHLIKKQDVLFLLPQPDFQMKDFSFATVSEAGFFVADRNRVIRRSSRRSLLKASIPTLKFVLSRLCFPRLSLAGLLLTGYTIRILGWLPVIDDCRPRKYITSLSDIGHEDPGVALFNALSIETIMWAYGTNSYFFSSKFDTHGNFNYVIFNGVMSKKLLSWNEHFKEFLLSHCQEGCDVVTLGPMMCGDEDVDSEKKILVRSRIGITKYQSEKYFFISVFDVPPVSPIFKANFIESDPNTAEYDLAFMRDVIELLNDFDNIFLIYKPKRSLTSGKFAYTAEFNNIIEELMSNERALILDYNINPWIPIAVADLTISMAFESPFIASLHYGRPSIFHDPSNIVIYHRYEELADLISHNYVDLREKVADYLPNKEFLFEKRFTKYVGLKPGTSSSERFRKYLLSLKDN